MWPGEKGAENIAASVTSTVSTTTLLDPSHGEDEHETDDDDDIDPEGAEDDDDDASVDSIDSVENAVDDPTAELKRLAEENAELRRQLAASSTKGGDA